jgi:hypothetical protein
MHKGITLINVKATEIKNAVEYDSLMEKVKQGKFLIKFLTAPLYAFVEWSSLKERSHRKCIQWGIFVKNSLVKTCPKAPPDW